MFVEHKEVGEVIEAPAKTMKLSEAIRIGSRIRPRCVGSFFADGGSCAVGAALEAVTGLNDYFDDRVPVPGSLWRLPYPIWIEIYTRNDGGMTREEIADWLEGQGL